MKKYFFDMALTKECFYDYTGRAFGQESEAHHVAHLMALDLASTQTVDWTGAVVRVRDVLGRTVFSIPVQDFDLVAA